VKDRQTDIHTDQTDRTDSSPQRYDVQLTQMLSNAKRAGRGVHLVRGAENAGLETD